MQRDDALGCRRCARLCPLVTRLVVNIREKLIEANVLVRQDGKMIFARDHLFSSPTAAAATVVGRSANGLTEWRDNKNRTLREAEEWGSSVQ